MDDRPCTRRRALLATGAGVGAALAGCLEGTRTDRQPEGGGAEGPGSQDGGQSGGGDESTVQDEPEQAQDVADQAPDDAAAVVAVGPGQRTVFEPAEVQVNRRDVVAWVWASDGHNLVPTSLPQGVTWEGEPEVRQEGHVHEYAFEVPGTYEYVCEPHEEAGMRGTLTVQDQ